jgi:hypothetical protein
MTDFGLKKLFTFINDTSIQYHPDFSFMDLSSIISYLFGFFIPECSISFSYSSDIERQNYSSTYSPLYNDFTVVVIHTEYFSVNPKWKQTVTFRLSTKHNLSKLMSSFKLESSKVAIVIDLVLLWHFSIVQ